MRVLFERNEQRGTLLIEALAMLGLIAMVTPTLYKKSAERLQEIQDINAAAQARTMNSVMETFMVNNFQSLMLAASTADGTIEVAYDDSTADCYERGYSSFLPFGYKPDMIKNYGYPKVYVHKDGKTLISYIIYPHLTDPGKKRAARLASLVGANGGLINEIKEAQGTGGSWYLDSSMIDELEIDHSLLVPNSLIVTSNEPIENSTEDNDKYLYRVPNSDQDTDALHNTMVTDLYLGGNPEDRTDWATLSHDYYGIYNVRKLTLNTVCEFGMIKGSAAMGSTTCDPNVADLYVGKPIGRFKDDYNGVVHGNTGAAWIYGNLHALNEGFSLVGDGSSIATMRFRPSDESSAADYDVVYASGTMDSSRAEVKFINDFVGLNKTGDTYEFKIASSMAGGSSDAIFLASTNGWDQNVKIATKEGARVYLAEQGGNVYINGSSSSSVDGATTTINAGGGLLKLGQDAGWMLAGSRETSTYVSIMKDGGDYFAVGNESGSSGSGMIYAEFGSELGGPTGNSSHVALYGRRMKISGVGYDETATSGGNNGLTGMEAQEGLTSVTTMYTDIFGSTYLGSNPMSAVADGMLYNRKWTLGVAGSAWVDDLLFADRSWFNDAGVRDFHAGLSSFADYSGAKEKAWLNVYAPGGTSGGGRFVVRDPNKAVAGVSASKDDVMFMASSGVAVMSDTEGAWVNLEHGVARIGTEHNYFLADHSDSSATGVYGSSHVVGARGVNIWTVDASNSSSVNLQNGALKLYGHAMSSGVGDNMILANAREFALRTGSTATSDIEDVQLYANEDVVRTRYVDFEVQRDGDASSVVFGVYPNSTSGGSANVEINGSIHIKGNEVIHIASDEHNSAENDSSRAMFEIDPNYIRVWAKDRANIDGAYGDGGHDYYAMLTINPNDVGGSSLAGTNITNDTSIYIRKGAIELEKSDSSIAGGTAADAGFGYILANRFVSNAGELVPNFGSTSVEGAYDQYMVNPAYTSVMHDIKLTTRGGARLSDILPDFVLKGVYNISNDYFEGSKTRRIGWSAGDACGKWTPYGNVSCADGVDVTWADPFVGVIPYAMCPPGYKNMATIVPISFQIGRAGRMVKSGEMGGERSNAKWMLAEPIRQTDILKKALELGGANEDRLKYPEMIESESFIWNELYESSSTFTDIYSTRKTAIEGWFWGLDALKDALGSARASVDQTDITIYNDLVNNSSYAVAEPLYFQEGTFLKTSLDPKEKGWEGRIGFLYNASQYGGLVNSADNEGIKTNNTDGDDNGPGVTPPNLDNYFWNAFPVPTNTLEGHATVYCYFDREDIAPGNAVLKYDALHDSNYDYKNKTSVTGGDDYIKRLNDPSLKYSDPW